MKFNILIISLLAIVPLSGCYQLGFGSIDLKPTTNITTIPASSSTERFIFIRDKKFGYIDRNGTIVIPAQFKRAENFSDGLARVTIGEKSGFIDRNGKIVIPIQFDEDRVKDFSEGLAVVEIGDERKHGFIDLKGNMVISPQFRYASNFKNGLANVQIDSPINNPFGYIDRRGKIVIPPRFANTGSFSEGLAAVDIDAGKYGYIDTTGKVVIPFQFSNASGFKNGRANVTMAAGDDSYRIIDRTGKLSAPILPIPNSKDRNKFSDGLAIVEIGHRLGYKDKNGKIVVPTRYGIPVDDKVHKGNFSWYRNGTYIPRTHICIPLENSCFSVDANFDRGLALVMIPTKCGLFGKDICHNYGYIDTKGKLVFKF
jgi:hypothetical protein